MINAHRDEVILVDENDSAIGPMTVNKYDAHRNPPKLHRAVSVWLLNSNGELLFQQRSQHKFTAQGWWANTICGNVIPGESYAECADRRLEEELGITEVNVQPFYSFQYWAYINDTYSEHEMDQVFVGLYDGEVKPNPLEVSSYRWWKIDELKKSEIAQSYLTAAESIQTSWPELKAKTPPVEIQMQGEKFVVTPWSVMMWQDQRLQSALETLRT